MKAIVIPDIDPIAKALARYSNKPSFLILDNSGLATSLPTIPKLSGVTLLVFESLNKYHQFGQDKTNAGIVWGKGKHTAALFTIRAHSGTNISDMATLLLPAPNKKLLQKRLLRFERNTLGLATLLHEYIAKNKGCPIEKVVYPALTNHPYYARSKGMSFHGSFFVLQFKKTHANIATYQKLQKAVIFYAKKEKINIVGGTSFGFDTTRIYLTALQSETTTPFIRVSVGTEPAFALQQLYRVFVKAIMAI